LLAAGFAFAKVQEKGGETPSRWASSRRGAGTAKRSWKLDGLKARRETEARIALYEVIGKSAEGWTDISCVAGGQLKSSSARSPMTQLARRREREPAEAFPRKLLSAEKSSRTTSEVKLQKDGRSRRSRSARPAPSYMEEEEGEEGEEGEEKGG